LDESIGGERRKLDGNFVSLFDAELRVQNEISLTPGSRQFLLDLDSARTGKIHLLASACKALLKDQAENEMSFTVEGVGNTPGILLLESTKAPRFVTLDGGNLAALEYSAKDELLWIRFENTASPRTLSIQF
jgi:hypothetical protein